MLTQRSIQNHLFIALRSSAQVLLPNYTPHGWHECDLFAVTKAGYAQEYEIKLSVSDFRADAKKTRGPIWVRTLGGGWSATPGQAKHTRLQQADSKGPTRFWYVTPAGLLANVTLPPWAGLIEVDSSQGYVRIVSRKDGPRLHRTPVEPKVLNHAVRVCYWRFWNERRAFDGYKRDVSQMRQLELTAKEGTNGNG